MIRPMGKLTSHTAPSAENTLSLAWVMAGVVLFATALGAPLAVVQLQDGEGLQIAEDSEGPIGKPVATASREARIPGGSGLDHEPLAALLDQGEIVPGVGIGPVLLDTDIRDVLVQVEEPSTLSYALGDTGLLGTHTLTGEDFNLTIAAEPGLGLINAVTLSAKDCAALRHFQPRIDGLPATQDGLSLGSHASRVRRTLGAPHAQTPASGRPPQVEHSYPGLRLRYCAQDMIVSGIKVERLPPAPLVASVGHMPATADTLIAAVGSTATESDAPSTNTARTTVILSATPLANASTTTPEITLQPRSSEPALAEPEALLAMNGSAFTAGDAFSAPRQPRDVSVFARTAAPSEMVLAVVRASVADEANAEFQGVDEFVTSQAQATEADLELSRSARGQIQRRLEIIGYDPKGVDGIFGPNTRDGIAALQSDRGMPATGFLDSDLIAMIEEESQPKFLAWEKRLRAAQAAKLAAAKRRKKARALAAAKARSRQTTVVAARVPTARNAPECARDKSGKIISNQSWSCDVTVLEEGLDGLQSTVSALFSGQS